MLTAKTNIMKLFRILVLSLAIAASIGGGFSARAQEQKSPEQQEKELREMIDKEVEKYSRTLDLDFGQEFYIDSILTHDFFAMREEMMVKSAARVSNTDVYMARIKENDTVVMDYVPVIDSGNNAGFWDKVSGTFKTVSTGGLTAGPAVSN